jgi:hypothetical protein
MPFVPPDFVVPSSLETPLFRLEQLGPQHDEADYAAWTSSIEHIRGTPGYPMASGRTADHAVSRRGRSSAWA